MNRKYHDRYTICINVEKYYYVRLNELLPKCVTFTDEINEIMKQRVFDLEKEDKVCASNKGPIGIYQTGNAGVSVLGRTMESRLDIYGSKQGLVSYVQSIPDSKTAWALKRNAMTLIGLAETRAKDLQRENK